MFSGSEDTESQDQEGVFCLQSPMSLQQYAHLLRKKEVLV